LTGQVLLGVAVAIVVGYRGPYFFLVAARLGGSFRKLALLRGLLRTSTGVAAGLIVWQVWAVIPAVATLLLDVLVARRIRQRS
jgi:hypothetical protein